MAVIEDSVDRRSADYAANRDALAAAVADLRAVQAPDLRPAPGIVEKAAGDVPQGVALDDGMLVRRVGTEGAAGGAGRRGGAKEGRRCKAGCDYARIFHGRRP